MEDFNIPSPERVALLEHIQAAIGDVPPYFWASCQVCDLNALQTLVEHVRISPAMVRIFAGQTYKMILHWTQSNTAASQTSTPTRSLNRSSSPADSPSSNSPPAKRQKTTNSPIFRRNQTASALAKQRDGSRCVLTGDPAVEVAHIYPFCWLKSNEEGAFGVRHTFCDCLKNFWPEQKVTAWAAELFPGDISGIGMERVYNLITLSPNAHLLWNRGAFALKPIFVDTDNTTLKVQFFWQKKQQDMQATISLLTTPSSTQDLDQNEGAFDAGNTKLFDVRTEKAIKSGDFFELQTDDAIARPLPSFKLLEMQWFLTRVVGMAGAAVPYEEDWGYEDSDDEISNPGLDEAEDDSLLLSDPLLLDSPLLNRGGPLPVEGSKHYTEAATRDRLREGDGLGDRQRGQDTM